MSFGKNLQFLRKMHNSMTQEELAERMGVSRQTISKWESETAYPEMEKAFELYQFFSCSMDRLFRENMNMENYENYSTTTTRMILVLLAGSWRVFLLTTPAVTTATSPLLTTFFSFRSSTEDSIRRSVESARLAWNGFTPQ